MKNRYKRVVKCRLGNEISEGSYCENNKKRKAEYVEKKIKIGSMCGRIAGIGKIQRRRGKK